MIAAGLLCRSSAASLAPVVAKYAGAILWGALVYWVMALVLCRSGVIAVACVAAMIAAAVEASQLIHLPWLDAFRRTTIGVLLIGRYFAWSDIAAYLVGIATAGILDWGLIRAKARP